MTLPRVSRLPAVLVAVFLLDLATAPAFAKGPTRPAPAKEQAARQSDALEAPRLARRRGEALVLPAPFAAVLARRYATSAARQSPMFTDEVAETELELDVTLPEGLRATVAPAAQHEGPQGRFSQRVSLDGQHLKLRSRFFLPTQRIGPADAAGFVSWAEAVDRAEAAAAHLTLTPVE